MDPDEYLAPIPALASRVIAALVLLLGLGAVTAAALGLSRRSGEHVTDAILLLGGAALLALCPRLWRAGSGRAPGPRGPATPRQYAQVSGTLLVMGLGTGLGSEGWGKAAVFLLPGIVAGYRYFHLKRLSAGPAATPPVLPPGDAT